MSAPGLTPAQQLQEEALFQRRKTIYDKIHTIRTKIYHLDKKMEPLTIEVQVAHIKLQAHRERVQYFTTRIPEVTQEHMEGNLGSEYAMALSAYENYKRNKPDDKEGIRREYDSLLKIHASLDGRIKEILVPLKAEMTQAMENVTKYKSIHDSAYDRLQDLELEKYDLVQELHDLVAEDTALNQPPPPPPLGRGRRLRRSTHNKGKKRRRSTHKRKKRLMQN
jgi:chromosome segregation ATPase